MVEKSKGRAKQTSLRPPNVIHSKNSAVRPCRPADIPQLVRLILKLFPYSSNTSFDRKANIINELLSPPLNSRKTPPSLVYQDKDGRIIGFIGVRPISFQFKESQIEAAISYNFMTDPDHRSTLAGMQLLRTFLSGSQDLSLADSATSNSRRLWEALGGTTAHLYSNYWKLPLRPLSFFNHYAKKKKYIGPLARLISPVLRRADRFWGLPHNIKDYSSSNLQALHPDTADLIQYIKTCYSNRSLRPKYDAKILNWQLKLAGMARRFGRLKKTALFDKQENLVGWYIYYVNPKGKSEVLQIGGHSNHMHKITTHLIKEAYQQGAYELAGRLEPDLIPILSNYFCFYTPGRMWQLVDTDNRDMKYAIKSGEAFLTRLEGDMWLL